MKTQPWHCSNCGYVCNATMAPLEAVQPVPTQGDVTICLNCGALYEMRSDRWEPVTEAEIRKLPAKLRRDLQAIQIARRFIITEDLSIRQNL